MVTFKRKTFRDMEIDWITNMNRHSVNDKHFYLKAVKKEASFYGI
jgi:hypothetical protein